MTNSTIELFEALNESDFAAHDPRRALIRAPDLLRGTFPVRHPELRAVRRELVAAIRGAPLTHLVGMSGVGKTRLIESLVALLNRRLARPGRIPAVALVAPTAQRQAFSWKALWERLLLALEDTLPYDKVDPAGRAEALRRGRRSSRTTEAWYFEQVCSAAEARGLVLLVIDEATALARSESGITLLDQIQVLRELADKNICRIVLVSTFDILSHLRRAGVLDRRLSTVLFPRYPEVLLSGDSDPVAKSSSRSIDPTNPGYLAFRDAAFTFMGRLPEASRFALTDAHYLGLYRGSLGCVGLLCDWYLRAIAKYFELGDRRFGWRHFERSPLPVDRRANLVFEARQADKELAQLRDLRLDLTEEELCELALVQRRVDRSEISARRSRRSRSGLAPAKKTARRRGSRTRPGIPRAKRIPLP